MLALHETPYRYFLPLAAGSIVLSSAAPAAWELAGTVYPPDCPLGRLGWPLMATIVNVSILFVAELMRFAPGQAHVPRIALSTLVLTYVGLFLSFLYPLRTLGGNETGLVALLSMLMIVKMSDVGAYAIGKTLGRHSLAPKLSPGKTIEGAIGGFAAAALVSWVFFTWFVPLIISGWYAEAWRSIAYGLVLAIAAIIGDLAESLIKRDSGQKDSSTWLPGLGGILDMLDSVILATPAAFFCWMVGLIG
jgi:phosphatidate cytidylyltransferase